MFRGCSAVVPGPDDLFEELVRGLQPDVLRHSSRGGAPTLILGRWKHVPILGELHQASRLGLANQARSVLGAFWEATFCTKLKLTRS